MLTDAESSQCAGSMARVCRTCQPTGTAVASALRVGAHADHWRCEAGTCSAAEATYQFIFHAFCPECLTCLISAYLANTQNLYSANCGDANNQGHHDLLFYSSLSGICWHFMPPLWLLASTILRHNKASHEGKGKKP